MDGERCLNDWCIRSRVGLVFDPIAIAVYYERSVYNFNNDEQMFAVAEMRKNLQYVSLYCIV